MLSSGTPPDTQQASSLSAPAAKRYTKSRPYYATVTALEGLCVVTSRADKDTIRVALDLGDSGLVYAPGDALGIYPVNNLEVRTGAGWEVVCGGGWRGWGRVQQYC
jgi:sulfite reductase (NADPH) flavoprotein alpha-component